MSLTFNPLMHPPSVRWLSLASLALLIASAFFAPAAPKYEVIKSFGGPEIGGAIPRDRLLQASDGFVYGVTYHGGREGAGCLYRANRGGGEYKVLHHFGMADSPSFPSGPLIEGSDGFLYGTTTNSGFVIGRIYQKGVVFRFDPRTQSFSVVKEMSGPGYMKPIGGVIEASDGKLYGAADGDSSNAGVIYSLNRDGSDFTVIATFPRGDFTEATGFFPLLEGRDGALYGTCYRSETYGPGFIFKLGKSGAGFQIIKRFGESTEEPGWPSGGLVEGSDGYLYGLLSSETSETDGGAVYRIDKAGSDYRIVHLFHRGGDFHPEGELVEAADGKLLGVTTRGGLRPGSVFAVGKDGSGFATLTSTDFETPPSTGLILTSDGLLLGATWDNAVQSGFLYSLRFSPTTDGPFIGHRFDETGDFVFPLTLVEGRDKWLYGTTAGSFNTPPTFFKIRRDGSELTLLRNFAPDSDQSGPRGPTDGIIAQSSDGYFYGSINSGGSKSAGAIFQLSPDGVDYRFLVEFDHPWNTPGQPSYLGTGILPANDGFIYGISNAGGQHGSGTIFRIGGNGENLRIMHSLAPSEGGGGPLFAPIEGTDGMLYGSAPNGFFSLNKEDSAFVFHPFSSPIGLFETLANKMVEASNGMLYWTHPDSTGEHLQGGIYRIGKDGANFAEIYSLFPLGLGGSPPHTPYGPLVEGRDGFLYGLTRAGGDFGHGVLYRLSLDGSGFEIIRHFDYDHGDGMAANMLLSGADGMIYGVLRHGGEYGLGALFRYGEAPEISVWSLLDGEEATELITDDTSVISYPSALLQAPETTSFTITNKGSTALQISRITLPDGYSLPNALPLPLSLPAEETLTFQLQLDAAALGRYSGWVEIENDDFDESTFRFQVEGWVIAPEIALYDGDSPASAEIIAQQPTAVDFGETVPGTPITRTFTIQSVALESGDVLLLDVAEITVPEGFALVAPPRFPIRLASGKSGSFQVRLEAATPGTYAGIITIKNNDPDEAVFSFPVAGLVTAPEIAVHDGATTAAPELATGQTMAVDFGRNIQGTPGGKVITIANTGTAPLAVASITVPPGYELAVSPALPATIAVNASASWEVRLVSLEVGVHAGTVVISSDDLDEAEFTFPITGEVFIPEPIATITATETGLNRQTGLREQTIRLANDTTATVPGYRLLIRGLPAGVTVANASEVLADGTVVVLVRQPLAPFASFDLVLEYASVDRRPVTLDPQITVEVVLEPPDDPATDGAGTFTIDRVEWLPELGGLLLEFGSEPGRLYVVQYSEDGVTWKSSPTQVRGAGNRTQWIDRGPPRTASPPASQPLRFYRVRALAE